MSREGHVGEEGEGVGVEDGGGDEVLGRGGWLVVSMMHVWGISWGLGAGFRIVGKEWEGQK